MDTKKLTADLIATGLTQQKLAQLLQCSQPTIAAYLAGRRGSNVTKAIGDRLERLHAELCKKVSSEVVRDGHVSTPARRKEDLVLPHRGQS